MSGRTRSLLLAVALLVAVPAAADAQINRLKKAATDAAEREAANQVDRMVAEAVRCAFDDPACIEEAEKSGEPVVLVDKDGNVITDDDGNPITDPDVAAAKAGDDEPVGRPGEGVWANYDFVPGERVLFAEHFEKDRVGDWPRRLEFVDGNAEVVEWKGGRFLRASDQTTFDIHLPEPLPERFTMEFDLNLGAAHMTSYVFTEVPEDGRFNTNQYPYNFFVFNSDPGVTGPRESRTQTFRLRDELTPVRIHVDGKYVKVYLGEQRISNFPNAELPRSDRLRFRVTANANYPTFVGNIQIAAGGGDLYDVLSTEGRFATQGILFDFNSDVIRPESTPTLREIGEMLQDHEDMSLLIEGHTDSEGDESYNQELSQRRAQAVVTYLVTEYGISAERLASEGVGESNPVADNSTPEGRQQNRRVELVVR